MINRRGSIGLVLLLVLVVAIGGFLAGVQWSHHPATIPDRVALDSLHLEALKRIHARDVAAGHRAADSLAAVVDTAAAAGDRETAAKDQAKQLATALRAARLAIAAPDSTLRDSLRFSQATAYAFNAENIALQLAVDRGDSALAEIRRALSGARQRANLLQASWTNSENELELERTIFTRDIADLKTTIRRLQPRPPVSLGLGADALAVLGSSPCFASVAGPQLQVRTAGWVRLEGRATAGYGAGGCVGESARTGPALQIGGSIGL